ncbi:DUF2752 domain-containing protein [Streptomyces sp. C10-9-1]|uniref:DUF2752 domain-containing protein n=1 Tax=Streptomyces sp. C10-9-1 TaxID=1859285 RepID=UPI003F4A8111
MTATPPSPAAPSTEPPASAALPPGPAAAPPEPGGHPGAPEAAHGPGAPGWRPAHAPGRPPGPHPGAPAPAAPGGPHSLARRLAAPLATLAAVAGAFAYVGAVDPNEPGHYPVCPLLALTGIYCPGCGGLRSAHAFVHGDLPAALGSNAAAVAGYLAFAVVWVVWLVRAARGRRTGIVLAPAWWWLVGSLLAVFSVVRNLPFGTLLAP